MAPLTPFTFLSQCASIAHNLRQWRRRPLPALFQPGDICFVFLYATRSFQNDWSLGVLNNLSEFVIGNRAVPKIQVTVYPGIERSLRVIGVHEIDASRDVANLLDKAG